MAVVDALGGARAGRRDHFVRRHAPIVQEPSDADFASPMTAERANPHTGLADLKQTVQQKHPPVCRRRSPNPPRDRSIALLPSRNTARDSEKAARRNPRSIEMCASARVRPGGGGPRAMTVWIALTGNCCATPTGVPRLAAPPRSRPPIAA